MTETPDIPGVQEHLPSEAVENGWDEAKIVDRWEGTVARTVREYWLERVNETAGYLDLPQDGLPASQIHRQAVAMLAYWDKVIAAEEAELAAAARNTFSRKMRRV